MKEKILSGLLLFGCNHSDSNPTVSIKPLVITDNIYTKISVGIDFVRTNGSQGLSLLEPYQDQYTGKQRYKTSPSLGLGLGLEREAVMNLWWQLGFSGYFNTSIQASGHRWEFGLPDFDNFSYRYQVQSSRFVVTGKLLSTYHQKYHPFLSGEFGASFNRAYSYNEHPLIEEELPMEPFTSHTRTNLSWGLGLGIDVDIRSKLRLGFGYQFADLGTVSLGISPAQETLQTLRINHLYDHQVYVQLTALI